MAEADLQAGAPESAGAETFEFQAEVAKLLHLMVHSVYSDREVFLRELISNAADACDRRRYEALSDPALMGGESSAITITPDSGASTLTIADNGIGMTRDELIANLGTIARSGTQRYMQALQERQAGEGSPSLIGQFGVGFYAAFMVADRVRVTSRHAGRADAHVWESDGSGAFTIEPADRAEPGTTIVLHMKPDAQEFLEPARLRQIVRSYSDHLAVPVRLASAAREGEAATSEPETLNSAQALWTRAKSGIEAKEYESFYQDVAGLYDSPLATLHFRAEGKLEYTALLFTPGQQPYDLFDPARASKVKLYVRRVFITDDCSELLPSYLRFLKGVVDAQDLPLNISREMLQRQPVLGAMKRAITGRVLSDYVKLSENEPETWTKVWELFGPVLKEGLYEDRERQADLLKLARFKSSASEGWTSLSDYVSRMKDGQEKIYYLAGETISSSPQLEGYRARGIEVLLLSDPVDDFWVAGTEFEGKPFESVTRAGSDLGKFAPADGSEGEREALAGSDLDRLLAVLKSSLGNRVKDVRPSERLTDSAVCLVAADGDVDLRLAKLLRSHSPELASASRILEINPAHRLIRALGALAGKEGTAQRLHDAANLLLAQAILLEGDPLPDPAEFARLTSDLLLRNVEAEPAASA
jgi:molecular chaperone HtpG